MTLTSGKKKCREGFNVCMNYKFNLLHHVGVVARRVCAAAAAETAHEGDDNTPSGPTGRGVKNQHLLRKIFCRAKVFQDLSPRISNDCSIGKIF